MATKPVDFFGVGIDSYPKWKNPEGRKLDLPGLDCWRMGRALQDVGLVNDQIQVTENGGLVKPNMLGLYGAIHDFGHKRTASKLTIFFFAGHACTFGSKMIICCNDFDADYPDLSGIEVDRIVETLGKRSKQCIFIFDCCRAPLKGGGRQTSLARRPHLPARDDVLFVLSCSQKQYSYEDRGVKEGINAGIFSHYLTESITRHCRNASGQKIPFAKIFSDARKNTMDYALKKGVRQTPIMLGAPPDSFILQP